MSETWEFPANWGVRPEAGTYGLGAAAFGRRSDPDDRRFVAGPDRQLRAAVPNRDVSGPSAQGAAMAGTAPCWAVLPADALAQDPPGALQGLLIDLRRRQATCQEIAAAISSAWQINGPDRDALGRIAFEADQSGINNAYHNPAHTRDVTASWASLAALNNDLFRQGRAPVGLSKNDLAVGLMAALGHDLGHDGTTNHEAPQPGRPARGAPGNRIPFRLEMEAVQRVRGILASHGISSRKANAVAAAILATDPVDGHSALLARAGRTPWRPTSSALAPLEDPACWLVAALLRDADLMTSAGLTAAEHDRQTALLMRELGQGPETPEATERFFGKTARSGFASPAGMAFMPQFNALRAINKLRVHGGRVLTLEEAARGVVGE